MVLLVDMRVLAIATSRLPKTPDSKHVTGALLQAVGIAGVVFQRWNDVAAWKQVSQLPSLASWFLAARES